MSFFFIHPARPVGRFFWFIVAVRAHRQDERQEPQPDGRQARWLDDRLIRHGGDLRARVWLERAPPAWPGREHRRSEPRHEHLLPSRSAGRSRGGKRWLAVVSSVHCLGFIIGAVKLLGFSPMSRRGFETSHGFLFYLGMHEC